MKNRFAKQKVDTRRMRAHDGLVPSLTIMLFGPLKDLAAARSITIDLPAGATAADALRAAVTAMPSLAPWQNSVAVADDKAYLRTDEPIGTRSTISLIPPVSGG